MIPIAMDIATRQSIDTAVKALDPTAAQEAVQQRLQLSMLKKTLQAQQEQSAEIMRMVEGKGNIIDIRV